MVQAGSPCEARGLQGTVPARSAQLRAKPASSCAAELGSRNKTRQNQQKTKQTRKPQQRKPAPTAELSDALVSFAVARAQARYGEESTGGR